jgi:hypothetical protein
MRAQTRRREGQCESVHPHNNFEGLSCAPSRRTRDDLVSLQRDSHIHDIHIDLGRHLVEPWLAPPAHDPIPAPPLAYASDIGISVE